MRLLTIGAKSMINAGLAIHPDCELIAMEPEPYDPSYQSIRYDRRSKLSLHSIKQVRHAIREHQPDVVHAFYPRPVSHAVMARWGMGASAPLISYRGVTAVPKRWSPDSWISYLWPGVAGHACESAAVRDALVEGGVPSHKCHVVHNCLTSELALRDREHARKELGLPATATVAMMVANMRPVKGADLLLEALAKCQDLPGLHLALIGRVMDARVESLASDPNIRGRVHLLGFRQQASQWLSAADVFVMPSRAEALSVALLEAMSAGVCPLVSDAGGMKEAVRHEVDGIVFPKENVDALASALRKLYESPALVDQYAASARERAETHFSTPAMVDRLMAMYDEILSRKT